MPRFHYKAYTSDGHRESGVVDAGNEFLALERLTSLGFTVTDIGAEVSSQSRRVGFRGPTIAQQADLADQLAILFGSGLSTQEVVRIIARSSTSAAIRNYFVRIDRTIADGAPFDQALAEASAQLSPLFGILAGIGQRTAHPGQQMPALATTLRRQERITSHIGSALIYPGILLAGGLGVLAMMALFLAPRLETIFTSVNHPVPGTIAGFIAMGNFLSVWGGPILAGFIIAVYWAARKLLRPSLRLRLLARSLPLIGPTLRDAALARLTLAVQLLLEAGLPLAAALRAASESFSGDPEAQLFSLAASALEEGRQASTVLAFDPALPVLFQELFRIGEETNSLPKVLGPAAQRLEDGAERRIQRLMALLTPALTLLIGGIIAMIVASVMGAVLSVNDLAI